MATQKPVIIVTNARLKLEEERLRERRQVYGKPKNKQTRSCAVKYCDNDNDIFPHIFYYSFPRPKEK